MIPKKNRLNSLFFKNLFKKGKSIDNILFSLKYVKDNIQEYKVSIVVSKKVSKKATERNLLKRRFLSVVIENKDILLKDTSYIFYPKKNSLTTERNILQNEIFLVLQKIYETSN